MRTPLIGVSTYLTEARWSTAPASRAALLPATYTHYVRSAGGLVAMLPPDPDPAAAARLVERLDGLVLTGGDDLDPALYGQQPHPLAGRPVAERDAWELALLGAALEQDTPVLGICRGMQVMNVHEGGTLFQHLPDQVGHDGHNPRFGVFVTHPVTAVPGTLTERLVPGSGVVTTHHHQAVDRLGSGLTATAHADDGTIEAVEYAGRRFALGVQWHPEMADDLKLLTALVRAAADRPDDGSGATS